MKRFGLAIRNGAESRLTTGRTDLRCCWLLLEAEVQEATTHIKQIEKYAPLHSRHSEPLKIHSRGTEAPKQRTPI